MIVFNRRSAKSPFRHLARPRRPQAQDRGRRAGRHCRRRSAREAGVATPALRPSRRADPRDRERRSGRSHGPPSTRCCRACSSSLDGRVALVTGAAQGIGRAIARAFARARARACISPTSIGTESRPRQPRSAPRRIAVDLGDRDAAHALVERDRGRDGGRLDILALAAAACAARSGGRSRRSRRADWRAIFDANVDGAFYLSQAAAPHMKRAGSAASSRSRPARACARASPASRLTRRPSTPSSA